MLYKARLHLDIATVSRYRRKSCVIFMSVSICASIFAPLFMIMWFYTSICYLYIYIYFRPSPDDPERHCWPLHLNRQLPCSGTRVFCNFCSPLFLGAGCPEKQRPVRKKRLKSKHAVWRTHSRPRSSFLPSYLWRSCNRTVLAARRRCSLLRLVAAEHRTAAKTNASDPRSFPAHQLRCSCKTGEVARSFRILEPSDSSPLSHHSFALNRLSLGNSSMKCCMR